MNPPIQLTDRISAVLARDPRMLDVLLAASPAFGHLRNPLLRKTMAKLATVEHAARVARVDPLQLVARLNAALSGEPVPGISIDREDAPAHVDVPPRLARLGPDQIVDCDVREDLRAGREPFNRILMAARSIREGGALRLRAIFEPAPLYAVLGRQGFEHFTERLADEDWIVWFWRGARAEPAAPADAPRAPAPDFTDDLVVLDVRGLEPPEPMVRTLEALERLPRGKTLIQINVRVPQFLLPRLAERGFVHEVREQSADLVRIFIRHADPQRGEPMSQQIELDVRAIPPRDKHPAIFRTFDGLKSGEAFTLVNDHDPYPLRHQFEATRTGQFKWTYLEQGPSVWRVSIGKT